MDHCGLLEKGFIYSCSVTIAMAVEEHARVDLDCEYLCHMTSVNLVFSLFDSRLASYKLRTIEFTSTLSTTGFQIVTWFMIQPTGKPR